MAKKKPGPPPRDTSNDERHTTLTVLIEVPVYCKPSQDEKITQRLLHDVRLSINSRARGFRPGLNENDPMHLVEIVVPDHMNE